MHTLWRRGSRQHTQHSTAPTFTQATFPTSLLERGPFLHRRTHSGLGTVEFISRSVRTPHHHPHRLHHIQTNQHIYTRLLAFGIQPPIQQMGKRRTATNTSWPITASVKKIDEVHNMEMHNVVLLFDEVMIPCPQ